MNLKQIIFNTILLGEIILFTNMYIFGKNGLYTLQYQDQKLHELKQQISQLINDITSLEQEIIQWNTNDFYKEKFAREKLQMARKHDKLFYIGS